MWEAIFGTIVESVEEEKKTLFEEPDLNLSFESKEALELYLYETFCRGGGDGRFKGFCVSKARSRDSRGTIYMCDCYGVKQIKKNENDPKSVVCRERKTKKTNCQWGVTGFLDKQDHKFRNFDW